MSNSTHTHELSPHQGHTDSQSQMSLERRESELEHLTKSVFLQIEQLTTLAARCEYLEIENSEVMHENENLQNEVNRLEGECEVLRREFAHSLNYIEELHQQLTSKIQEMAVQKMETEKLKLERLVFMDSTDRPNTTQVKQEESRNSPEENVSLRHINEFVKRSSVILRQSTVLADSQSSSAKVTTEHGLRRSILPPPSTLRIEMEAMRAALETKDGEIQRLNLELDKLRVREEEALAARDHEAQIRKEDTQLLRAFHEHIESVSECEDSHPESILKRLHQQMEEKIRWQAYAEKLLRLIIHKSPQLLEVAPHHRRVDSSGQSIFTPEDCGELGADLAEGEHRRWEDFAFSLLQKVISQAPQIVTEDDLRVANQLSLNRENSASAPELFTSAQQPSSQTDRQLQPNVKSNKNWFTCCRFKRKSRRPHDEENMSISLKPTATGDPTSSTLTFV